MVLSTQWVGRGRAGYQGGSDSSALSGQNPQLNLRSQPAAWLLGHFLHFNAKQQQVEMLLRGSGAASGSKTALIRVDRRDGRAWYRPVPHPLPRSFPKQARTGQPLGHGSAHLLLWRLVCGGTPGGEGEQHNEKTSTRSVSRYKGFHWGLDALGSQQ